MKLPAPSTTASQPRAMVPPAQAVALPRAATAAGAADCADADQIALALGLRRRAVNHRATVESWPHRRQAVRGGHKRLYPLESLPADVQAALAQHRMSTALALMAASPEIAQTGNLHQFANSAVVGSPVATTSGTSLAVATLPNGRAITAQNLLAEETAAGATAAQRHRRLARSLVVRAVQELAKGPLGSVRAAAYDLLARARRGELPTALCTKLREACDERGGRSTADVSGLPSAVTLQRWVTHAAQGHDLTPKASAVLDLRVKPWYVPFFALCDRPQKPTLKWAHDELLAQWNPAWSDPPGSPPPSYDAAVRAYNKRSKRDALKGRHSGSALRALSFYQHRSYADLAPFTEVHADGWTTHFTAPHPKTGAFVTYEVWHYHCAATKMVAPFAIGLTENTDVILEGLQACIRLGGVPAVLQTDSTGSIKGNERVMAEGVGLADRLGISVVHPVVVGNSQANGIAENFNTWLDRESRALATYQHPERMDSATFVRTRRLTNAMVKADGPEKRGRLRLAAQRQGKGMVFDSYAQAVDWLRGLEAKWNQHPHRALPKVRCSSTGRMVHMSPLQALELARQGGWQPVSLSEAELADAFRPHLKKKVTRGTVSPWGGMRYRATELDQYEGEWVMVAVEPEDSRAVWVKDLEGRLLCTAEFVEAVGSRHASFREYTERKRATAQIKRREQQIGAIEAGLAPAALEMAPAGMVLDGLTNFVDLQQAAAEAKERLDGYFAQPEDEVAQRREAKEHQAFVAQAQERPEEVDPIEIYLRRKAAEQKALLAQALEEDIALMEAARQAVAAQQAAQAQEDSDGMAASG